MENSVANPKVRVPDAFFCNESALTFFVFQDINSIFSVWCSKPFPLQAKIPVWHNFVKLDLAKVPQRRKNILFLRVTSYAKSVKFDFKMVYFTEYSRQDLQIFYRPMGWKFLCLCKISPYISRLKSGIKTRISNPCRPPWIYDLQVQSRVTW